MPLADESVQMIVTSPPYFNLRIYDGHNNVFGSEATVRGYVDNTIKVLREVCRVVKNDGVVFWNVGDCYSGKNLLLVPQRVAIAAQDDGWIVRQQIIWHKPNCVPESVKDRCTNSYEVIIVLAKKPRYFWNTEECREKSQGSDHRIMGDNRARTKHRLSQEGVGTFKNNGQAPQSRVRRYNAVGSGPKGDRLIASGRHGERAVGREYDGTRNMRSVWSICTKPHEDAHVAIMPEELAERCIRLGSKSGDLILDPFGGSGTSGAAAEDCGRNAILLDISPDYCQAMKQRFDEWIYGFDESPALSLASD